MKKIIALILIGLFSSNKMIHASDFANPLDLTGVSQILRPNDAQGVALGITGVAFREGLFAGYANPAGLIFDKYAFGFSHIPSINVSHQNVFNQEAVCLGIPIKSNFCLSALFYNLDFGDITIYHINDQTEETEKSGVAELQISLAKRYLSNTNEFSFGTTFKYLNYYIASMNSDTYLFDFGFRYTRIGNRWYSFGSSISNIGNDLLFTEKSMGTPLKIVKAGISFGVKEFDFDSNVGFMNTIEYQKNVNDTDIEWNHLGVGLEIIYFSSIFTRIGYSFDFTDNTSTKIEGITYGLGVTTPRTINIFCPIYLSFEYGRGLSDYRDLDVNIISMSVFFDI